MRLIPWLIGIGAGYTAETIGGLSALAWLAVGMFLGGWVPLYLMPRLRDRRFAKMTGLGPVFPDVSKPLPNQRVEQVATDLAAAYALSLTEARFRVARAFRPPSALSPSRTKLGPWHRFCIWIASRR